MSPYSWAAADWVRTRVGRYGMSSLLAYREVKAFDQGPACRVARNPWRGSLSVLDPVPCPCPRPPHLKGACRVLHPLAQTLNRFGSLSLDCRFVPHSPSTSDSALSQQKLKADSVQKRIFRLWELPRSPDNSHFFSFKFDIHVIYIHGSLISEWIHETASIGCLD
jgi:hypothetical protein